MSGNLLLAMPNPASALLLLPPPSSKVHEAYKAYEAFMDEMTQISKSEVHVLEQIRDVNTALLEQLLARDEDKEARIRRLERVVYMGAGALAVLSLLLQATLQLGLFPGLKK